MRHTRLLLILLLSLPLAFTRAGAHGGGEIQIANAPVGPYKLTAWLNPPQPQAGKTMHITIGLSEPPDDAPMLDAAIAVQITAVATNQLILTTQATTAQSINRLFYETDFTLADVGDYVVTMVVTAPGGEGTAVFPMTVNPARDANWLLIGLLALVVVTLGSLYRNRTAV